MFDSFIFERLSHLKQFYSTEEEYAAHLMSGEVKMSIPDIIKIQNEYERSKPELPSSYQVNQVVDVKFRKKGETLTATVRGVHFYPGKVKYDLGLWLGDGTVDDPESETRLYNVDSIFVTLS